MSTALAKFTLGADPEIFLRKNGKAISAHGLIPGTKYEPYPVEGGAIQVDGTALEFNIEPTPIEDFELFDKRITSVQEALLAKVREVEPDVEANISSVQDYSPEYFQGLPESAVALGCEPDWDAYTERENPMPNARRSFRTGAGHIHFGWGVDQPVDNPEYISICSQFVKVLDATVGLYCCLIEDDPRRRELYGKAGAFRPKPYGVEYRTPSNVWLRKPEYRRAIHTLSKKAVELRMANWQPPYLAQNIINKGFKEDARYFLETDVGFRDFEGVL